MSKGALVGGGGSGGGHAPPDTRMRRRSARAPAHPGATSLGVWAAHRDMCPHCQGHRLHLHGNSCVVQAGQHLGSTHPCPPSPPVHPCQRRFSQAACSGHERGSSRGSQGPHACRGVSLVSFCGAGTCSWGNPACAVGATALPHPHRASSATGSVPSMTFLITQTREGHAQTPNDWLSHCTHYSFMPLSIPCANTSVPLLHPKEPSHSHKGLHLLLFPPRSHMQ